MCIWSYNRGQQNAHESELGPERLRVGFHLALLLVEINEANGLNGVASCVLCSWAWRQSERDETRHTTPTMNSKPWVTRILRRKTDCVTFLWKCSRARLPALSGCAHTAYSQIIQTPVYWTFYSVVGFVWTTLTGNLGIKSTTEIKINIKRRHIFIAKVIRPFAVLAI